MRLSNVPMNALMRERILWLRGGQTEALVAWSLRDLGDEWHVFHNVEIRSRGTWTMCLSGLKGSTVCSTKAYKGLYAVDPDGNYLLNG